MAAFALVEARRRRERETGKEKLKRPSAGTRDRGEGSDEPEDHEIGPPGAPAHDAPPQGQKSSVTREPLFWQRPKSAIAGDTQSNREATASSEAKSILRGVKESLNVYLPLKSIAESLCIILDDHEVRSLPGHSIHEAYGHSSDQK